MILIITDRDVEEDFDTQVMNTREFNQKSVHPFIITTAFDNIYFDLDCDVDYEILRALCTKKVITPIIYSKEFSSKYVSLLCIIYQEYSGALRYYYMKDIDKFNSLINELIEKYNWKVVL